MNNLIKKRGLIVLASFFILQWILFFTLPCFSQDQFSYTKAFGLSFGSPGLVSLRMQFTPVFDEHSEPSEFSDPSKFSDPWIVQIDYSDQVLFHNRSNGRLKSFRLDAQREMLIQIENIKPFYFLGVDYFTGKYDQHASRLSLVGVEAGIGLRLPVAEHWLMSGELGSIFPTQFAEGFEKWGLIFNLSLMRIW